MILTSQTQSRNGKIALRTGGEAGAKLDEIPQQDKDLAEELSVRVLLERASRRLESGPH